MDAPAIQYARTSDGVKIAYATAGSGPPVLRAAAPRSHIRLDWEGEPLMQRGAQLSHLAWYDSRGSGLSDRQATDFSIDAMLRDLEAVVNAVAFDEFVLVAGGDAVPIAVTYAGQQPARVTRLLLMNGWVSAADYQQGFPYEIEQAVRSKSHEAWLEASARLLFPESPEAAQRWVAEGPTRIDTDKDIASQAAMGGWNAESFLADIRAPTLVIASRTSLWLPPSVAQRIATTIEDCRLVFEDLGSDRMASVIGEFILGTPLQAQQERPLRSSAAPAEAGTAVILFLDIADSTALTTHLGDAAYREKERELDTALRAAIRESGGSPVEGKVLGDGVMAVFSSASNAIDAALACGERGRHAGLPLHAGIHAGDVIREGNNVHGGAVQVAARIAGASAPGEVLVSQTVRDLARTSAGVSFGDRGERDLKGVGEPVKVFAVRPEKA